MNSQFSNLMSKLKERVARISMRRSYLSGLVVIGVLVGGGALGWGLYNNMCQGQSLGACLLDAINPLPKSEGRGVGVPMGCGPDEEQDGALCYPKCDAGYDGVGPVCWQACPAGFRDDGGFCAKPEPYGRGAGYIWEFGDPAFSDSGQFDRCEAGNGSGNCELIGAIVYPKCQANFHAVGTNICSPDCPAGMDDMGVSCTKKSYGRTAGVPLHACSADMEADAGLCYPKCKAGFKGVGPVCWEE
jgi:hypothetical protein